jgi:hypothetical protein
MIARHFKVRSFRSFVPTSRIGAASNHQSESGNSSPMDVIVEGQTLTRTDSGSVVGSIWLRSNQEPRIDFPEAGWTDFPVAILGWWPSVGARQCEPNRTRNS